MRHKNRETFSTTLFTFTLTLVVPVLGLIALNIGNLFDEAKRRLTNILGLFLIIIYWLFFHTWHFPFESFFKMINK